MDNLIFDGRHRLKACLDSETTPRFRNFAEVAAGLSPIDWVLAKNLYRRHLTEDQALAIVTTANGERLLGEGAARKTEGRKEGGRGHKKNSDQKSDPSLAAATLTHKNARSRVGRIAADAKSTRHKAAQALAVQKAAPELLEQVAKGEMKLKAAHAKVKTVKAPSKPQPRHESSYLDDKTRLIAKIIDAMRKHQRHHGDLRQAIIAAVGRETDGDRDGKDRSVPIIAFIEHLDSRICSARFQTRLMGYGNAGLVGALDSVQRKLAFFADLQGEITRRRKEAEAASEGAAPDKQLDRIIDWVQSELERFKRERSAGKPKAK